MMFYDPDFVPLYEPRFTNSTIQTEALEACGGDTFCLFDIAATGRMEVGLSTLSASQELEDIIEVSQPGRTKPHLNCIDVQVSARLWQLKIATNTNY